jgi:LPXTG-motif cell wall-anchored protein
MTDADTSLLILVGLIVVTVMLFAYYRRRR